MRIGIFDILLQNSKIVFVLPKKLTKHRRQATLYTIFIVHFTLILSITFLSYVIGYSMNAETNFHLETAKDIYFSIILSL